MKKLTKFLVCILSVMLIAPLCFSAKLIASASTVTVGFSGFSNTVSAIINDYSKFTERVAGSENEKQAADYINNYLKDNTSLEPLDNTYVKKGIQTFQFESKFSNVFESSQNIIYQLKSSKKTDKKVILGCHYDAVAFDMDVNSETYGKQIGSASLNGSAGSVATLLALAKFLPLNTFDFNIEFVFFGAGESDNAGSYYYTTGLSNEVKDNIICMINLNQIAFGEHLYFYMNEIETNTSNYVESVIDENKVDIKPINIAHLNKNLNVSNDVLNLGYSHIALDSDNANFMREKIQTINIFSGDYSKGIVIGRQEKAGEDLITYTINDNAGYILENYQNYSIEENLYKVFKGVSCILTDFDFVKTFEDNRGEMNWFYAIFTNQNIVFWLTMVAFIVFIIVAMFVYYRLSIKAYHANVELEFLSSVMKITDGLDKGDKSEDVAKVVTQVVANDIKKDKVIKKKSTKKDKQ